jgi:hypothetical protein
MTLFIVLVLSVSLVWLGWEGWQWHRRVAEIRQASGTFSAEVAQRALRQELDQMRVLLTAQQQQLATLQEEIVQLKSRLTGDSSNSVGQGVTGGVGQGAAGTTLPGESSRTASAQPLRSLAEEVLSVTTVSPEYAEPLALARRGLDPEALVARCGVTMAEAQLIWALAQLSAPQESQAYT